MVYLNYSLKPGPHVGPPKSIGQHIKMRIKMSIHSHPPKPNPKPLSFIIQFPPFILPLMYYCKISNDFAVVF